MDWKLAVSLLVPSAIAVAGWFVAHQFNLRKELAARRRELIVGFLIDAYRKLEKSADAVEPRDAWSGMESAIADIQLFGSSEQVDLAQKFAREIATKKTAFATTLLEELRRSLRSQLELERVGLPIIHLRFRRDKSQGGR